MKSREGSRALFHAAIVLVAACGGRDADSADSTEPTDTLAIAREWAVGPRYDNLRCSPTVLNRGDTLRIVMTLPHGPTFHIAGPDGTPFIVVFHGEGQQDRTQRRSLMPPGSFAATTSMALDTRTLKAGVWVFGRDTNETVFTTPGFYRLRVGSDMETDGPLYAECVVRYRP